MVLVTSMGLLAQGSTWQTATLISSGQTKTGTLDATTTEAWYKINVTQEGTIDFTLTASEGLTFYRSGTQVYGYWQDAIRAWGTFSGDLYANNLTFTATNAGKGTYYIRINRNGGSGTFTLKYKFTRCSLNNDPEPNDDYEHASLLQSGTTQGRLGYCTADNVTDTDDWYKIVVPEEGKVELVATATENLKFYRGYTQVLGYWQDAIRAWGDFSGDLYADTLTFTATNVGKGTYYIRISRTSGSGGYRLKYTFTPCPLAADPEPNNDYEHATLLQTGTTQARLGYRTSDNVTDKEDWFKIVVPEDGRIELVATATEDLKFYRGWTQVYGYWQDAIRVWGDFSGDLNADTLKFTATNVGKGTYYIRIYHNGGSGGYRLKYTFTPCPLAADPEPDPENYESATLLKTETTQARLGYRTSDNVTDKEDWFKIVVPEDGRIELVATATENLTFYRGYTQVYGYWQDAIRAWGDFSGELYEDTLKFTATNVAQGTYYIRIYHNGGSGGYRLKYTFTPCPLENDFEPNNDYQHYNRLINGKTTEAHLGYRNSENVTDNEDWYRINVPTDGDIELVATATQDLTFYRSGTYVYIYRDNNIYGFGGFSGSELYSPTLTFTATNVAKGTYYIRIVRGGGSGGYTMRYNGPASEISGDVDGDGIVNISDVAELTDILLSGSGEYLPNGDADGDGRITIADVTEIVDMLTGN